MTQQFKERLAGLEEAYVQLININNEIDGLGNGVFDRYKHPVTYCTTCTNNLEI
jgi:4-O-beta-D-mannosyl-D-glucose phosphorylase